MGKYVWRMSFLTLWPQSQASCLKEMILFCVQKNEIQRLCTSKLQSEIQTARNILQRKKTFILLVCSVRMLSRKCSTSDSFFSIFMERTWLFLISRRLTKNSTKDNVHVPRWDEKWTSRGDLGCYFGKVAKRKNKARKMVLYFLLEFDKNRKKYFLNQTAFLAHAVGVKRSISKEKKKQKEKLRNKRKNESFSCVWNCFLKMTSIKILSTNVHFGAEWNCLTQLKRSQGVNVVLFTLCFVFNWTTTSSERFGYLLAVAAFLVVFGGARTRKFAIHPHSHLHTQ